MSITDLADSELKNKKVLVRVDFNTPMQEGDISDDSRIREAIPTINYLRDKGAKVILASHLGRPKGGVVEELRLTLAQKRLSELLNKPVIKANDCVGSAVQDQVESLNEGDVMLLENLRFHSEEVANDPTFSKDLAGLADMFVLDAFGAAHRAHASTAGVASYLPSYAGLLLEKEMKFLGEVLAQPTHPFLAIIGGAKVSTKLGVLQSLLGKVDHLVIGGGMAFTFLKAQGIEIGKSLVEDELLDDARSFLEAAVTSDTTVLLPTDVVISSEFSNDAVTDIVSVSGIPSDKMGLDVGPQTVASIGALVGESKTILWNGPLGVFELPVFAKGTFAVAEFLSQSDAMTIVGGGDSVSAIRQSGLEASIDHLSTGGGASLEYIKGEVLPGIAALEDKG